MMECSCEIDIELDDGDSCDFVKSAMMTARNQHTCSECKNTIAKGVTYENVRGCWDGDFHVYKTCPDCLSLRNEFFRGGYFFGYIWEHFRETVDSVGASISEGCISHLTPVARGRVCDIIQAWWEHP